MTALATPGCGGGEADQPPADAAENEFLEIEAPREGEAGTLSLLVWDRAVNEEVLTSPFDGGQLPPGVDATALTTITTGPDGALWGQIPVSGYPGSNVMLLKITDTVETIEVPAPMDGGRDIGVGTDDTVLLFDEADQLVRFSGDQVTPVTSGEVGDLLHIAVAPDGTVYAADHSYEQIIAIAPDGSIRPAVTGLTADDLAVGSDGTLYYTHVNMTSDSTTILGLRALSPTGEIREVMAWGTDEPEEGALAADLALPFADVAVNDDGIYLSFQNQIWQIDENGRLHLVVQRRWERDDEPPDDNEIRLYDITAGSDQLYVWDHAGHALYRVDTDE